MISTDKDLCVHLVSKKLHCERCVKREQRKHEINQLMIKFERKDQYRLH